MLVEAFSRFHFTAYGFAGFDHLRQAGRRVRMAFCAMHGHELMLHFERGRRICLRCMNCGYETPGWRTK